MFKRAAVAVALVAACGGGGDDCDKFYSKLNGFLATQGKAARTPSAEDKTKFLGECRARAKSGDMGKDAEMFKCIVAAPDNAVGTCMAGPIGDYVTKSKMPEARLQLTKLGKAAKVTFLETAAFPIGKSTYVEDDCCKGPNHKCAADPEKWAADPMWRALDFELDEPHYFRYAIEGTATTMHATAIGDLDCDGTAITYTLEMTAPEGNPKMVVSEPPASSD